MQKLTVGSTDWGALLLTKALIRVSYHWNQLIDQYIYDTSADSWKVNILHGSKPGYYREVHTLLTTDNLEQLSFIGIEDGEEEWVKSANHIKKLFSETSFFGQRTILPLWQNCK